MEKTTEAFEKLAATLEVYRKNKTLVPPEELAGRYRKSFERLKQQLKGELEEYLRISVLGGLRVIDNDEGRRVADRINRAWKESGAGRVVSRAAFWEFDLWKIKRTAQEHRRKAEEIYREYLDRHTCLYAAGPSWDPDSPQPPLIYNDIVDKFYDEAAGGWISREKPPGAAVLIFLREKGDTE